MPEKIVVLVKSHENDVPRFATHSFYDAIKIGSCPPADRCGQGDFFLENSL
jgi:hypothetical protein